MVSHEKIVHLASGQKMPIIGLGTWKSPSGKVKQAVIDAIDAGYRLIDCALAYMNEDEVGAGLQEKITDGTITREDVFIVDKCWNTYHKRERVIECCKLSLKNLGLEYLDLYLIHWPFGYKEGDVFFPKDEENKFIISDIDYLETWEGMEDCVKLGLVRSIGFCNFNIEQIQRVMKNCSIKPVMLQVECHPYLNQKELIDFCHQHNIQVIAYSPLGSKDRPWAKPDDPSLLENPKLQEIAKKNGKTTAQVLLRFQIQRGVIVIPKSVTKERIVENIQLFDFKLSKEDMEEIENLNRGYRFCHLNWVKHHPHYPFKDQ